MNPVQAAFFSMTSGAESGDDAAYLAWHLLDHLPEQYSIPGVRLGTRWFADEECVALRAAAGDLAPVRHVVSYLMTDPVADTLTAFAGLGRQMAEAGRFPERATSHFLGAFHLQSAHAAPSALVSAAAVPFRPHRGVYLIVEAPTHVGDPDGWRRWHDEEHVPSLLAVDGVAGTYVFRTAPHLGIGTDQGERFGMPAWNPSGRLITLVYLDGEVAATALRLDPLIRSRWATGGVAADLAGPLRSMVTYDAWPLPRRSPSAPASPDP